MSAYDAFRDQVPWQAALGEPEIPGVANLGPEQTIPARVIDAVKILAGDRVSVQTVWTLPAHQPSPGDRLNGGDVLAVEAAKSSSGSVLWWVSYVQR